MSIDTSGPHQLGRWPSSRPEDLGKRAYHFLLAAYVVESPAAKQDRERLEGIARESAFPGFTAPKLEPLDQEEPLPGSSPQLDAAVVNDSGEQDSELAKKVAAMFGIDSFGDLRLRADHPGLSVCVPNFDPAARPVKPKVEPDEKEDLINGDPSIVDYDDGEDEAGLISKTWYFCVPLENLKTPSCIRAIETVLAQLRMEAEGADLCYRIHGDRAGNLTGEQIKKHFAAKSPPDRSHFDARFRA